MQLLSTAGRCRIVQKEGEKYDGVAKHARIKKVSNDYPTEEGKPNENSYSPNSEIVFGRETLFWTADFVKPR